MEFRRSTSDTVVAEVSPRARSVARSTNRLTHLGLAEGPSALGETALTDLASQHGEWIDRARGGSLSAKRCNSKEKVPLS
jgi:hypothetical protein